MTKAIKKLTPAPSSPSPTPAAPTTTTKTSAMSQLKALSKRKKRILELVARIQNDDPTLTSIELDSSKVTDKQCILLSSALASNSYVTEVNLRHNKITHVGAAALAEALEQNMTVSEVYLGKNCVGPEGARSFANVLSKNVTLRELGLDHCGLGDEGGAVLLAALGNSSSSSSGAPPSSGASSSSSSSSVASQSSSDSGGAASQSSSHSQGSGDVSNGAAEKSASTEEQEEDPLNSSPDFGLRLLSISGNNIDKTLRRQIKSVLDSKKKLRKQREAQPVIHIDPTALKEAMEAKLKEEAAKANGGGKDSVEAVEEAVVVEAPKSRAQEEKAPAKEEALEEGAEEEDDNDSLPCSVVAERQEADVERLRRPVDPQDDTGIRRPIDPPSIHQDHPDRHDAAEPRGEYKHSSSTGLQIAKSLSSSASTEPTADCSHSGCAASLSSHASTSSYSLGSSDTEHHRNNKGATNSNSTLQACHSEDPPSDEANLLLHEAYDIYRLDHDIATATVRLVASLKDQADDDNVILLGSLGLLLSNARNVIEAVRSYREALVKVGHLGRREVVKALLEIVADIEWMHDEVLEEEAAKAEAEAAEAKEAGQSQGRVQIEGREQETLQHLLQLVGAVLLLECGFATSYNDGEEADAASSTRVQLLHLTYADLLHHIGNLCSERKKYDDAVRYYNLHLEAEEEGNNTSFTSNDPSRRSVMAKTRTRLGRAYLELGMNSEAAAVFASASPSSPPQSPSPASPTPSSPSSSCHQKKILEIRSFMKNLHIDPPSFTDKKQEDDGYEAHHTTTTTALVKKVEAPTLLEDDFGAYSDYGDEFDEESHHYSYHQEELLSLDKETHRYQEEETALALIESPSPSYETKCSWREEKRNLSTSLVVSSPATAATTSKPRERRARADLKKTLERYYSRSTRDAQPTTAVVQ